MPSLSTSSLVKGRSSGQSRVRGFTMIEVLVALVILSFGVAAVLLSYHRFMDVLDRSSTQISADLVLDGEMQRVTQLLRGGRLADSGAHFQRRVDVSGIQWALETEVRPAQRLPHDIFFDVIVTGRREGSDRTHTLVTILYQHDED